MAGARPRRPRRGLCWDCGQPRSRKRAPPPKPASGGPREEPPPAPAHPPISHGTVERGQGHRLRDVGLPGDGPDAGGERAQVVARPAREVRVHREHVGLHRARGRDLEVEQVHFLDETAHLQRLERARQPALEERGVERLQLGIGELAHEVARGRVDEAVLAQQPQHRVHVALLRIGDEVERRGVPGLGKTQVQVARELLLLAHVGEIDRLLGRGRHVGHDHGHAGRGYGPGSCREERRAERERNGEGDGTQGFRGHGVTPWWTGRVAGHEGSVQRPLPRPRPPPLPSPLRAS